MPNAFLNGSEGPGLVAEFVSELRRTAAPDLYDPGTYIPWRSIEQELVRLDKGIERLQAWVERGSGAETLPQVITQPGVLDVIRIILVTTGNVGFADGSEIPQTLPRTESQVLRFADLLDRLGLGRLLGPTADVKALATMGLIARDSRRRGFRRRDHVKEQIATLVRSAIEVCNDEHPAEWTRVHTSRLSVSVRNRLDYAIARDGSPVAAIATGIYGQSGGRQQRELRSDYPAMQEALELEAISLIAIVDGNYVRDAPQYVLERLVTGVDFVLTVNQAKSGGLVRAIYESGEKASGRALRPADVPLQSLIEAALNSGSSVEASSLPVERDQARLALSAYIAAHPNLSLALSPDGSGLAWRRPSTILRAIGLRDSYDPEGAIGLLAEVLRAAASAVHADGSALQERMLDLPEDRVLPPSVYVRAIDQAPSLEEIRQTARRARTLSASATLAVVLTPDMEELSGGLALQKSLAASVVVIDAAGLHQIVAANSPRDAFVQHVLEQADLAKTNPFNPTGATRSRMFFGRDDEEAAVLSTLDTASVALLGGRRIGKTSLLQRVTSVLDGEGWAAHYADCQSVGDWGTFAGYAASRWEVEVSSVFSPTNIRSLVSTLKARDGRPLVLVMDEVDYLLKWDSESHDGHVPEAFFRECRALSQEGVARFLFSGERLIAERMWDPKSPHYNFCKALNVRQLSRRASDSLILHPLEALGLRLIDRDEFAALAWRYTSGHPHLVQYLGERVVEAVNMLEPSERHEVHSLQLKSVAETAAYKQHYVETYWGQATPLEKAVSLLLANGVVSHEELLLRIRKSVANADPGAMHRSLRMLALYGLTESVEYPVAMRAKWFSHAAMSLGGVDEMIESLLSDD